MTLEDIKNKVRAIMNEVSSEEELHLLSEDTVKLDEYIQSCIPDAINMIVSVAPLQYLNPQKHEAVITTDSHGIGLIYLPDNFMRFVSIKLKSWNKSVSEVHPFGSDQYNIQHNPVTRAGANKPVCVFSYNKESAVIECFPGDKEIEFFYYVKQTESNDDLITPKDKLFGAICYMCASLVYNIFENPKTGEQMKSIALEQTPKS